jgi:hypothetical protein
MEWKYGKVKEMFVAKALRMGYKFDEVTILVKIIDKEISKI